MAASGTAEIQQVGKISKTNSAKGKETASRKGRTRPPLNFLSILHNAEIPIDTSCPDKLCKQLYAGVFLKDKELQNRCRSGVAHGDMYGTHHLACPFIFYFLQGTRWGHADDTCVQNHARKSSEINALNLKIRTEKRREKKNSWFVGHAGRRGRFGQKYFVDEKTNSNCFMLFARKLEICWSDDSSYWKWTKEETCGEEIEVAELKEVCWLDIRGKFDRTIDLSPGAMYEIVFVVRMINNNVDDTHISNFTVTLEMILPHSRTQRNERLQEKSLEEWFEILVGEFIMSPENVGSVEFSMTEHVSDWKTGLIVKSAIIRPKKE